MLAMSIHGGQWGDDAATFPSWVYVGAAVTKDGDTSTVWNITRAYPQAGGLYVDLSTIDGYSSSTGVPISSIQPVAPGQASASASVPSPGGGITVTPSSATTATVPYYKKPLFWAVTSLATGGVIAGIALAVRASRR